jgi:hypothetical protein
MAETFTQSTAASPVGSVKTFAPLDPQTFVPQLVWLALTFGLLYVLLKRFALPRVGGVIKERQDRIRGDLDQAEKLKAETEQALAGYEQALTEARDRGRASAMDMRDKLMGELNSERRSRRRSPKSSPMPTRASSRRSRRRWPTWAPSPPMPPLPSSSANK